MKGLFQNVFKMFLLTLVLTCKFVFANSTSYRAGTRSRNYGGLKLSHRLNSRSDNNTQLPAFPSGLCSLLRWLSDHRPPFRLWHQLFAIEGILYHPNSLERQRLHIYKRVESKDHVFNQWSHFCPVDSRQHKRFQKPVKYFNCDRNSLHSLQLIKCLKSSILEWYTLKLHSHYC